MSKYTYEYDGVTYTKEEWYAPHRKMLQDHADEKIARRIRHRARHHQRKMIPILLV